MISFGPRATLGFFLTPSRRPTAGAVTYSAWRSRSRTSCGASASRSPACWPIVSARARAVRGGDVLRHRSRPDGVRDDAADAQHLGRRASSVSASPAVRSPSCWRHSASSCRSAGARLPSARARPQDRSASSSIRRSPSSLIDPVGWQEDAHDLRRPMLLVLPFSLAIATAPAEAGRATTALAAVAAAGLSEASAIAPMCCWCSATSPADFSWRSSPFTCRPILVDRGLSAQVGGWTIAVIGLFNIVGSLLRVGSATSCPSATFFPSSISRVRWRCSSSSYSR